MAYRRWISEYPRITYEGIGGATTTIKLDKKLGAGCFAEVLKGHNEDTSEEVAVKLEPVGGPRTAPMLEHEHYLLMEMTQTTKPQGFTVPFGFTDTGVARALVLPCLGLNLYDCVCKANHEHPEYNYRLSVKTVLMVAEQVLRRLEYLHSFGVVHRDIKPHNFMWGRGPEENVLYLIDFGLSKRYFDYAKSAHMPMKQKLSLTGTARYASVNAHKGFEQSRRDDLVAVGHMFADLLIAPLPWSGLPARTSEEKYRKICETKETTPLSVLFERCSNPDAFVKYLEDVRSLGYTDIPDYSGLRNRFSDHFRALGFEEDYSFDWSPESSPPSFDGSRWFSIGPWTPPLQPDDPSSSTKRKTEVIRFEDVSSKSTALLGRAFLKGRPSRTDPQEVEPPMFADAATRAAAEQKWSAEEELKARAVFKKWDLNGDGTLSIEELREVLATLDITGEGVDDIFKALDTNENGTVEVDEFLTWVFGKVPEDIRESYFSIALHQPLEDM